MALTFLRSGEQVKEVIKGAMQRQAAILRPRIAERDSDAPVSPQQLLLPRIALESEGEISVGPDVQEGNIERALSRAILAQSWSPWIQAKRMFI